MYFVAIMAKIYLIEKVQQKNIVLYYVGKGVNIQIRWGSKGLSFPVRIYVTSTFRWTDV